MIITYSSDYYSLFGLIAGLVIMVNLIFNLTEIKTRGIDE
jgi:hypothetical protein